MIELFPNISQQVRDDAEFIWHIALHQKNGRDAAKFLTTALDFYENLYTTEEIQFLYFFLATKIGAIEHDSEDINTQRQIRGWKRRLRAIYERITRGKRT